MNVNEQYSYIRQQLFYGIKERNREMLGDEAKEIDSISDFASIEEAIGEILQILSDKNKSFVNFNTIILNFYLAGVVAGNKNLLSKEISKFMNADGEKKQIFNSGVG